MSSDRKVEFNYYHLKETESGLFESKGQRVKFLGKPLTSIEGGSYRRLRSQGGKVFIGSKSNLFRLFQEEIDYTGDNGLNTREKERLEWYSTPNWVYEDFAEN